ncbi:MAG: hypothetical protein QNK04_04590 [Myxococcota bacterium]|nr:hypothetical protein [Myxococcota bacterium]
MAHSTDDTVAHPEILTLHWEGPQSAEPAPSHAFPESPEEARAALDEERERELREIARTRQGREIWEQIEREAGRKGDESHWRRKLHAYWWVKMKAEGSAGDYARRQDLNHATVRSWISDVAKLAYQVGYRLHEDRLVLVGEAPVELKRLRELVNADAAGAEASAELRRVAPQFRGEDPYFHLNEGHVLRALGQLRESDDTLREGLTIAEAPRVRSLLWNARGQTLWDCTATSSYPLRDHLARAEKAFRRAAILDRSTFFPFVNLAQMAQDSGDDKRCEYWIGELQTARKRMSDEMTNELSKYLADAEWTRPIEGRRFWKAGPAKWLAEAVRKGVLAALAALALLAAAGSLPASADPLVHGAPDIVENGGGRSNNSGAGGN